MGVMSDPAEHLAAALESLGHTIAHETLVSAMAMARTAEIELAAGQAVARVMEKRNSTPDPADAERYRGLLDAAGQCTPSLDDFKAMEAYDPNVFWRLDCGHHQNLLEAALDEIDDLRAAVVHASTATSGKDNNETDR